MTTDQKLILKQVGIARSSQLPQERFRGMPGDGLQQGHVLPGEECVRGGRNGSPHGLDSCHLITMRGDRHRGWCRVPVASW